MNRRDVLKSIGGAAVLALSAACSQASAPAPTAAPPASGAAPTAAPASAQTTPAQVAATGSQAAITFWGAFTGHNADVQTQLVDRFNQSQKDVQVTLQNQNDYASLAAKLTTALQARNAPEVTTPVPRWPARGCSP